MLLEALPLYASKGNHHRDFRESLRQNKKGLEIYETCTKTVSLNNVKLVKHL